MEFHILSELIQDNTHRDRISEILELKSKSDESYRLSVNPSLKKYVEEQYAEVGNEAENIESKEVNSEKLNKYFVNLLNSLG